MAAAQSIHASDPVRVCPGGMDSTRVRTVLTSSVISSGVGPSRFLGFEVPDAVYLGVSDVRFFHGGLLEDALLAVSR
ncbi:hypothetical protein GCM10010383_67920 [Streptomyces lomondensis]|uniref:Uncharacterized protein n=1 Tax=Streptomyces lomondensis TaxID=68229 RepID=A0ABQ2XPF3_9ACTN|nr:hypothetical protein GCM10010383_67920 [Streptomyces lomondensis]